MSFQIITTNPYNQSIINNIERSENEKYENESGYSSHILELADFYAPSSNELILLKVFRCFYVVHLSASAVGNGHSFDKNFMSNILAVDGIEMVKDVTTQLLELRSDLPQKQILQELKVCFIPETELIPF